jgi:hypothetical protein
MDRGGAPAPGADQVGGGSTKDNRIAKLSCPKTEDKR